MEQSKIEIKEMPSKEVLEQFVTQMVMGLEVSVIFDYEKGLFIDMNKPIEQPRCGWA